MTPPDLLPHLELNTDLARRIIVNFICDAVQKVGFEKAVIGLSGGIDSALSAYLTAEALGAENVKCIRMPYQTSSPDSLSDAQQVIDALGCPHDTVEITDMAEPLFARFPAMDHQRRGNVMARLRMIVLYDQSVDFGGLVMGTSNKTEFMLGYTTLFGDSGAAIQPIADLHKHQVRQMARAVGVPGSILDKAPSADLWQGQTDEDELGYTYDAVDQLLYLLIDQRYRPEECIAVGFAADFVRRVWRQVRANHYKRTMPNVVKISQRTIGQDFLYLRDWSG
ncbi:MAG: NAD+ synthase [Anaerolineales bacterium]